MNQFYICLFLFFFLFPLTLSAGDRSNAVPTNTSGSLSQDYPSISEEKRELILRIRKRLCQIANENDFNRIKRILRAIGERYLGEEITIEEAYPHIYCNEAMASNIDLIRVAAEYPRLNIFLLDFLYYFTKDVPDKSFFRKMVSCKRDFGDGCLDVFDHIEKNRMSSLSNEASTRQYDFFKKVLRKRLAEIGGPIRDPEFCREVLDEPLHCQ